MKCPRWACAGVLVAMSCLWVGPASAQEPGTVTGQVLEANTLNPVPQAQLTIEGRDLGTIADEQGRYRIGGVPAGEVRVRAQLLGYQSSTQVANLEPGGRAVVNFRLRRVGVQMQELVVTATGRQRRVELGNAQATLRTDEVELGAVNDFSDLLSGRLAGVQILPNSGTTGQGGRIRIRGSNSISLGNEPLIYVDGIRVVGDASSLSIHVGGPETSRVDDLDPSQIASIEVVKGPSAATLYGTEAANGVIRITTKRGEAGPTRWHVFVDQGMVTDQHEWPANYRGFAADGTACRLLDVALGACQQDRVASFNPLENDATTPYRTGHMQEYGMSLSGGSEGLTYFLSGNYKSDEGVTPVNDLRQASVRANLSPQLTPALRIDVSTWYLSSDLTLPNNDNQSLGLITNAGLGLWTQEIQDGYGFFPPDQLLAVENSQDIERFTGAIAASWSPLAFLEGRATVGVDYVDRHDGRFFPPGEAPAFQNFDQGAVTANKFNEYQWTVDLGVTATADLTDALQSRTSIGAQYFHSLSSGTLLEGRQLVAGTRSIGAAATVQGSEQTVESITAGTFLQEQLGYRDRLFVTGAVRFDDNSTFGQAFDLTAYPKVSASWLMSEEDFFPSAAWLQTFRVRAAWGESGLQPGTTDALFFYQPRPVTVGGSSQTGVTLGGVGNPDLKPERASEIEAGFDAEALQGRLGLEFTYYNKLTSDALMFRELPPSLGATQGRFENLGEVRNEGVEARIRGSVLDGEVVGWDVSLIGSTNSNELVELGEGVEPIIFPFQRHVEGFPAGGYWQAPIERIEDANGDGLIGPSEVQVGDEAAFVGSPFPDDQLTITSQVSLWDWLRFDGLMEYRGGHHLFNLSESFRTLVQNSAEVNDPEVSLERQGRAVASLLQGTNAGYIEPADFWRLRELSVAVTVPSSWVERWFGATSAALTFSGRNLGLWTDYSGVDPEVNSGLDPGLDAPGQRNFVTRDFFGQPPVRSFTARLDLTF